MNPHNIERSPSALSWVVGGLVWFVAGGVVAAMFFAVIIK